VDTLINLLLPALLFLGTYYSTFLPPSATTYTYRILLPPSVHLPVMD
jgi:hypothetical protein